MMAEAEAEAVRIKAEADTKVIDQFAREMEFRRVEVQRVRAFGSKTVFVPSDGPGAAMGRQWLWVWPLVWVLIGNELHLLYDF